MTDDEKEKMVQTILDAIATATPDKLKALQLRVAPIEPTELKAEVTAIGTEDKSDAERVAEIKEALMKLDDAALIELQTAILTKGGNPPPPDETRAILERRKQREAELARRLAANRLAAEQPLGKRLKHTAGDLLRGLLVVFTGLVSSAIGNARRRRTRRA
jgi:hypothetical protein